MGKLCRVGASFCVEEVGEEGRGKRLGRVVKETDRERLMGVCKVKEEGKEERETGTLGERGRDIDSQGSGRWNVGG